MSSHGALVAVLAGGNSTRMGRDKAEFPIAGRSMLELVLAAAHGVGEPIVIGRAKTTTDAAAIPDLRDEGLGPLAGLETALDYAAGRDVVLVAVDQPFIRPATLNRLLSLPGDAVVPRAEDRLQVLCAVYRPPSLKPVRRTLDDGARSLLALFDRITATVVDEATWAGWGEDGRSWFSVDTPGDIEIGLQRFG